MSSEQKKEGSMMVPMSILIAGVLIAGAVFFSGDTVAVLDSNDSMAAAVQAPSAPKKTDITALAVSVGVDKDDFEECMASGDFEADVKQDSDDALKTGGRGTPWNVVIGPDGSQYSINGAQPFAGVTQFVDLVLEDSPVLQAEDAPLVTAEFTPVTEKDHIRGSLDAKVIIVEFSDYDCPFCKRFHNTMIEVFESYDESEVAWVYRHFPLDQLHPEARTKAVASECIASLEGNDAFWAFSDLLGE